MRSRVLGLAVRPDDHDEAQRKLSRHYQSQGRWLKQSQGQWLRYLGSGQQFLYPKVRERKGLSGERLVLLLSAIGGNQSGLAH